MGRTNVRFWERGEKSPGRRGFFVFSGRSNSGLVKRSLPTMGGEGSLRCAGVAAREKSSPGVPRAQRGVPHVQPPLRHGFGAGPAAALMPLVMRTSRRTTSSITATADHTTILSLAVPHPGVGVEWFLQSDKSD